MVVRWFYGENSTPKGSNWGHWRNQEFDALLLKMEGAANPEEFTKALVEDAKEEGIEVAEATGTTSAQFVIRPYVGYMNPGFYAVVSSAPSQMLDEVVLSSRTASPIPNTTLSAADADKLSIGGRWREDARVIGAYAARYLDSRVNP